MPGSLSIRSSTVAKPGRCETFLRPLLGEVNSGARAIRERRANIKPRRARRAALGERSMRRIVQGIVSPHGKLLV